LRGIADRCKLDLMTVKQFAKELKETVEGIKASGSTSIDCNNLIAYLDKIASSTHPDEYEQQNAALARHAEFTHQSGIEMFKSVIAAGLNATKTSMLLNGGAAVAMLAFIGHVADAKPDKVAILAPTILPFALGAFLIGLTSGGTYLSQWFYAKEKTETVGFILNIFCIAFGAASFIAFLWGLLRVYAVLGTGL
jgi:hypothetical protein